MDIEFQCPRPGCGATIGVRGALAGKQARCPACHQVVPVPRLPEGPPEPAIRPVRGFET